MRIVKEIEEDCEENLGKFSVNFCDVTIFGKMLRKYIQKNCEEV